MQRTEIAVHCTVTIFCNKLVRKYDIQFHFFDTINATKKNVKVRGSGLTTMTFKVFIDLKYFIIINRAEST